MEERTSLLGLAFIYAVIAFAVTMGYFTAKYLFNVVFPKIARKAIKFKDERLAKQAAVCAAFVEEETK